MNTIELQNNIIRKILNTDDDQLLSYFDNMLNKESGAPGIYELNDFEKQLINESLADYQDGKTTSNDDAFSKIDKWLEK